MKRKIKTVTRFANQLTNAKPEYVSLVGHGANQTPFRTVKSDEIADLRDLEPTEETETMAKTGSAKVVKTDDQDAPKLAEIHKVVFDTKNYKDKKAVSDYLETKGYTDFKVKKSGETFVVEAKEADAFEGEIKEIKHDKGVVFFVGTLKADAEALDQESEREQKSMEPVFKFDDMGVDEIVQKYDSYFAMYSNGRTIEDVMKEGADGLPPGIYELNEAFYTALRNLLLNGEVSQVSTLTAEFGDMIVKLVSAMVEATIPDEVTEKVVNKMFEKTKKEDEAPEVKDEEAVKAEDEKAKKDEDAEVGDEAEAAKDEIAEEAEAGDKAEDKAESEEEAEAGDEEEAQKGDEGSAGSTDEDTDAVAKAVAGALGPAIEAIKALTEQVGEIAETSKKGLAELDEKVSKAGERVEELEKVRQTRKSAEDEGDQPSTENADEATKAYRERATRSILGIRSGQ